MAKLPAGARSAIGHRIQRCWSIPVVLAALAVLAVARPSMAPVAAAACAVGSAGAAGLVGRTKRCRRCNANVALERGGTAARRDELTGLLNRAGLHAALNQLDASDRGGQRLTILFCDVDGLKSVNDAFGHLVGDTLLQSVANRLVAATPAGSTVARFGGDEFVVAVPNRGQHLDPAALGGAVLRAVGSAVTNDGFRVTVSVGVATGLIADGHPKVLVAQADAAMYEAKGLGGDRVVIFDDNLRRRDRKRAATIDALRDAVADGALFVHYQPIVATSTRQLAAIEALVRWERPGIGLVSAAEFLPAARRVGLCRAIDDFVLAEACRSVRELDRLGFGDDVAVSVNMSASRLHERTVTDVVGAALDAFGIEPHRLVIEVPESLLDGRDRAVPANLHALSRLGVRVAVDDFGAGSTSLGVLGGFEWVDIVKLDSSLVAAMVDRPRTRAVVDAVVALARRCDIVVVAEGVETDAQIAAARDANIDLVQGFRLGRPGPVAALAGVAAP